MNSTKNNLKVRMSAGMKIFRQIFFTPSLTPADRWNCYYEYR